MVDVTTVQLGLGNTVGRAAIGEAPIAEVGVQCNLDFTTAASYSLDFAMADQGGRFGKIRCIFANNTSNPTPLSILIEGSQQLFTIPANTQGYFTTIATPVSKVLISGAGGASEPINIVILNNEKDSQVWYKFGAFNITTPIEVNGTYPAGTDLDGQPFSYPVVIAGSDPANVSRTIRTDAIGRIEVIGAAAGGNIFGNNADGTPPTAAPVLIGGWDGVNVQTWLGDNQGRQYTITYGGATAAGAALTNNPVTIGGLEVGTGFVRNLGVNSSGYVTAISGGGLLANGALANPNPITAGGRDGTGNIRTFMTDNIGRLMVVGSAAGNAVYGPDAVGTPPTQPPVLGGGEDLSGNVRSIQVDANGGQMVVGYAASGSPMQGFPVPISGIDGAGNVRTIFTNAAGEQVIIGKSALAVTVPTELVDANANLMAKGAATQEPITGSQKFGLTIAPHAQPADNWQNIVQCDSGNQSPTLKAAPGAGKAIYITGISWSAITLAAHNLFRLQDLGGAVIHRIYNVNKDDITSAIGITFRTPIKVTDNTALQLDFQNAFTTGAFFFNIEGFIK